MLAALSRCARHCHRQAKERMDCRLDFAEACILEHRDRVDTENGEQTCPVGSRLGGGSCRGHGWSAYPRRCTGGGRPNNSIGLHFFPQSKPRAMAGSRRQPHHGPSHRDGPESRNCRRGTPALIRRQGNLDCDGVAVGRIGKGWAHGSYPVVPGGVWYQAIRVRE